ncbi:MAG: histidinol-phosphatase [Clostridia bacterium]|nr:histidinol-phosphatase [Clostridia bacterium]
MLCNYHTHTKRCHHATGTDREYVESAIKLGIKVLGFSDHAPYIFDGNYYSHYRMFIDEIGEYKNSVLALKREYKNDIDIKYGFELEYYPDKHQREMEFIKKYEPEYLILGQHFVGSEPQGSYIARQSDDSFLINYVNECIEGLKTGDFIYLAHPDIVGYDFSEKVVDREYSRLLQFAKDNDFPVEVNVLGISGNRWYSKRKIFTLAKQIGTKVIIGIDAHSPQAISQHSFDLANELVSGLNLNIIEKLDI